MIGYARSSLDDEQLRNKVRDTLPGGSRTEDFLDRLNYVQGQYDEAEGYSKLLQMVEKFEEESGCERCGRLFYLALPPSVYPDVCTQLKPCTAENDRRWCRLVIEKPFGRDLESSEKLADTLGKLYPESQLYRIDHYLGKEIVQNLSVLRFANTFMSAMWNRHLINNVQITFKEPFGTEGRGGYFDKFGIVRDIIQNHLLQVLALVAMEPPVSTSGDDVRDEKVKVLRCLEAVKPEDCVLGQYDGYRGDPTVPDDSKCPTFASCAFKIHNERWEGVPFILKAGKALNERKAEVRIQFNDSKSSVFDYHLPRNELVMRIQPDEGMWMKTNVKEPGLSTSIVQSELDLSYVERYNGLSIPDAYERLLLDAINGNQQFFVRRDELRAAWKCVDDLLERIDNGELTPILYPQGSRGPPEADHLAERYGFVRYPEYTWKPTHVGRKESVGFVAHLDGTTSGLSEEAPSNFASAQGDRTRVAHSQL